MTDTIQKIADDMQNWRSLPAWQVDQLHNRLRALSARASAGEGGEPVAWLHDDCKDIHIITDKIKRLWLAAREIHVEHYNIPLYATPATVQRDEWRCFHCDEAFTDRDAAVIHFGAHECQRPACLIDAAEYRRMEAMEARYAEEDADCHRAMHRQASEHQVALLRAEEAGYAKGLRDSGKCPCATPPAHGDGEDYVIRLGADDWNPYELLDIARLHVPAKDLLLDRINECLRQQRRLTARPAPEADARDGDTKRLDWLLDKCAVVKTDGEQWRVEYEWLPEGNEGPFAATKRAAIDAAIAAMSLPAQGREG